MGQINFLSSLFDTYLIRKKSVDDILSNSQEVIGSSLTQAYTALTTGTPLQRSPSPSRKNVPVPTSSGSPSSHSSNPPPPSPPTNATTTEIDRDKENEKERDKDSSGGYSSSNKSTKLSKSDSNLTPNYTCPDNLVSTINHLHIKLHCCKSKK